VSRVVTTRPKLQAGDLEARRELGLPKVKRGYGTAAVEAQSVLSVTAGESGFEVQDHQPSSRPDAAKQLRGHEDSADV
jgi:hypothetical protein